MISAPTEKERKVLTMAEYIEREAISEEIRKYYYKNPPNSSYGEGFDRGLDRAQRAILDAPAVDVVPVRHGRWAHLGGDEWCCSVCGFVITTEGSWDKPIKKYCEDCGARMDEVE